MKALHKLLVASLVIISSNAFAAEMPKELHGRYVSSDQSCVEMLKTFKEFGEWGGIEINAEGKYSFDGSCNATKVTGSKGNYTISESCSLEGESYNSVNNYKKEGNNLFMKNKEMQLRYIRCDSAKK